MISVDTEDEGVCDSSEDVFWTVMVCGRGRKFRKSGASALSSKEADFKPDNDLRAAATLGEAENEKT